MTLRQQKIPDKKGFIGIHAILYFQFNKL